MLRYVAALTCNNDCSHMVTSESAFPCWMSTCLSMAVRVLHSSTAFPADKTIFSDVYVLVGKRTEALRTGKR